MLNLDWCVGNYPAKTITSIVVHEIYVQNSDNVLTKGTRLFIFM